MENDLKAFGHIRAEKPIAQRNQSWGVSFLLAKDYPEACGTSCSRVHISQRARKGSFVNHRRFLTGVSQATRIFPLSVRCEVTKVGKHWVK